MSLTREFCERLVELSKQPLSGDIHDEACRSMINVLGTAVGASRHEAVNAVVKVGLQHGGKAVAYVPGRDDRLDLLYSALSIGLAAHIDDFDDTHLETVIHPSAATLGAVLPLSLERDISGGDALRAFALGCEAQLRVGVAMSPWHYDEGWHITGTCGVIGAAVAAGILIKLDAEKLAQAVGIAASETLGHRETFGSTIKSFHPGKAATNGLLAALLAECDFTASSQVLEAPRGFFNVLSPHYEPARVMERLGDDWELSRNTYKPYPCGIVSHPAIDAAVALAPEVPAPEEVTSVTIRCHPLVPELTGNAEPQSGLEARFSTIHGVAAGLVDGRVGLPQYEDSRVADPEIASLRRRVQIEVDDACARDAAAVEVKLEGGNLLNHSVEHARGSLDRPLTNEELHEKMRALIEPVLPESTEALIAEVNGLTSAPNLGRLDEILGGKVMSGVQR